MLGRSCVQKPYIQADEDTEEVSFYASEIISDYMDEIRAFHEERDPATQYLKLKEEIDELIDAMEFKSFDDSVNEFADVEVMVYHMYKKMKQNHPDRFAEFHQAVDDKAKEKVYREINRVRSGYYEDGE